MSRHICYPCERTAELERLPPRERVVVYRGWRVVHAFSTSLRGWLVAVPMRHVERFADLTDTELAAFGPLARACSIALQDAVGCEKTYVGVFGEHYTHLHAHVIPRMPALQEELWGPRIFALLDVPEKEWLPEDERDCLAQALRDSIRRQLDHGDKDDGM